MIEINGGETAGTNLFHSLRELSVKKEAGIIFNNDPIIQNIFARVTGGEASIIDGLLKTQGEANLFLINPVGIIFGENARLDIGGSFFGTTADKESSRINCGFLTK